MSELWPHTQYDDIQGSIRQKVGASDLELEHPDCRTGNILRILDALVLGGFVPDSFKLIDLCCGDGIILTHVQRAYPDSECIGLDLRRYKEHEEAEAAGARFVYEPLQWFIRDNREWHHLALMLNTFRNWGDAHLPPEDADLPERVEAWFRQNVGYSIVTVDPGQRDRLRQREWLVHDIGKGERKSRMVCMYHRTRDVGKWNPETLR